MSEAARKLLVPIMPGGHARMAGRAGLRRICLTVLAALVLQFGLGMILNLYVPVPASDQNAGFVQEVRTAPFALSVHAVLGIVLICGASVLLVRAGAIRDFVMVALAAAGLGSILGAYAAGEVFVRNGQNSASLWMAILTAAALVCYIAALALIGMAPARAMRAPSPSVAERQPGPAGSPAVPRSRSVSPLSGPQRRLSGPQPRIGGPERRVSGPLPRAAAQGGPGPRGARETGPRPSYPVRPYAPAAAGLDSGFRIEDKRPDTR
ncbi:MAG: hypothetical protein JOY82_00260 [Streptosporangiaceae bacterium]|nr:hypothetical protein [Streptosporangiaceae bacterium]MBV9852946.1 hypothetical protein [Streptosporangiaceae bacterium]